MRPRNRFLLATVVTFGFLFGAVAIIEYWPIGS